MLKKIIEKYAQVYIQFLPIIVFIAIARVYNFTDTGWMYGFYAGTLVALLQSVFLIAYKVLCNRFLLAINLFLFVGSLAFLTNSHFLLMVYEQYQQIVLFIALLFVGIITTFFTSAGFIGVTYVRSSVQVRRYSVYLLGATGIGLVLAYALRAYGLVATAVIFTGLRLFSEYLEQSSQ